MAGGTPAFTNTDPVTGKLNPGAVDPGNPTLPDGSPNYLYQTTGTEQPAAPQAPATTPTGSGTGIINQPDSTPQQTQAAPPTPTVDASKPAYTPAPYTVTPDQTVEGRTQGIINLDSPLMQQAQTRAKQFAQSRGILNSSMAAGAGESAVLDAAVPIATADASTFNQAMTNTKNAENAALQSTLQSLTTLTNTQLSNQEQTALANLDAASKQAIATLGSQNAQLLQANTGAANMFQEVVKNIAAIAVDATLSPEAKTAATNAQMQLLTQGLQTIGGTASTAPADVGNLNLGQYFQQAGAATPAPATPGAPAPVTPAPGAPAPAAQPAPGATADAAGQPLPNGPAAEAAAQVQPQQYGMSQLPNGWWAANGGQYPSASAALLAMGLVFNGANWVQGPSMTG